jgi:DNA-directed RNA polymerase specialized sigma24 family protein
VGEQEDLERFAGVDEAAAREAFARLCVDGRRILEAFLKRRVENDQDREDAIQDALANVWKARARFRNQGGAAWRGLLRLTAMRCWLDRVGRTAGRPSEPEDALEQLPDEDLPTADDVISQVSLAIDAGRLYDQANVLWLALDPAVSPTVHTRQLLAAQLFYLDREPWDQVLRLLPPEAPGEPPLTREVLDCWLSHAGVLRLLAYQTLYFSNHRLAACILGLPESTEPRALDEMMRLAVREDPGPAAPGGWKWPVVVVLLWRYRSALTAREILSRSDCPYDPDALEGVLVRSAALLPFSTEMAKLLSALARAPRAREALGAPGLWQRLAFQYRYQDDLPQRDIQERTAPAAEQVGYSITPGVLNVWLSGGRLLRRLAQSCPAQENRDHE